MNEIKERQHISDAAWERREFKTHSRKTCEKMRRAEGTMLVTVEEWDTLVAKLAERDTEIAFCKEDAALYREYAEYWRNQVELLESRKEAMPNGQRCNATVHDVTGAAHPQHAALTMLPTPDHRLGRGNG